MIIKSIIYVLPMLSADLTSQPFKQLHPNLLHDPNVWSLSDLRNNLAPVLVIYIGIGLPALLLQLVLSDLLIEDVVEELVQVLLRELVVQLAPVGLDDIGTPGGGAVG